VDDAFALVRAVHLAATIVASGTVCFTAMIVEPAIRQSSRHEGSPLADRLFSRMRLLFRIGLILAVLSGAGWFLFVAADISDRSPFDVFSDDIAVSVLIDTQFGRIWLARLAFGVLLFLVTPFRPGAFGWPIIGLALAACLLVSLAWIGHAGATVGTAGDLHLLSDILHFAAAGAWVGGLVPLALLIAETRREDDRVAGSLMTIAVNRFSVLGVVSVAAILATGVVNKCLLIGSAAALYDTEYGRLLTLKVMLFAAMISIAAINRFHLSPQLPADRPSSNLARNCWIEAALGLGVIGIVGMLTLLPPGAHLHADHDHSEHMAPSADD
jgi:putative copper resistance protein D